MSQAAVLKSETAIAFGLPEAPVRAYFSRLTLRNFRSHAALDLRLDGRPVALIGRNGAGKTNILEAISMFGPGRGLRGARLEDLPCSEGDGGWAVSARLVFGGDERRLGVGAEAPEGDRRICRVDQRTVAGPSAFPDLVRLLWLTPALDRLFVDGAGERRRFLDRMTTAHDPAHARVANDFEAAMRQRQKLLDTGSRDDAWLCALELQMAEAGVAVAAARRDMAGALAAAEIIAPSASEAFPEVDIALEGALEAALAYAPAAEVEDDYARLLAANRRADAIAGRALNGPHRSDLLVTHRAKGRPARTCSTGEQKALLIGLVLANARALAARAVGAPLILLLDEIAAHLDSPRRAALFDILFEIGFQTFMTGADAALFDEWEGRAQSFNVAPHGVFEI